MYGFERKRSWPALRHDPSNWQVKVKLSLCAPLRHMGELVQLHLLLTSTGGEWSASRLGRLTPEDRALVPTESAVGNAPHLVRMFRKKKGLVPARNSTPDHPELSGRTDKNFVKKNSGYSKARPLEY